MNQMVVYRGWERQTEVPVSIIDRGCGAGEIACIECGGDGNWKKFLNDEQIADMCPGDTPYPCMECKGTGRVLVSI